METFKILLFDEDKLTQTIVENYLKELTFECTLEKYNEFNESIINESGDIKLIIININSFNRNLIEKIAGFSKNKNNKFIIISSDNSTDLQVRALRAGCCDFLLKPLIKSDFIYSIQTIYNKYCRNSNFNSITGIYTAVSSERQEGKTFFLLNLAKVLSDDEKTILIDLNPLNNLSSFIKNSFLIQADGFKDIKKYKNSNLYIANNIKVSGLDLNELKKYFKYILIDYNEIIDDGLELIKSTDRIFALITPKNTISKEMNKYKNLLSLNKNVNLIINKYDKKYSGFVEKFQQTIGLEALLKIPNSVYSIDKSKIAGETIVEFNKELDISKCYTKLAEIISSRK